MLDFYSDLNYVRSGSVIYFEITDCPRNCAGHGNCIANHCHCNELYTGAACDIEICPEYCNNGTRNGQCSKVNAIILLVLRMKHSGRTIWSNDLIISFERGLRILRVAHESFNFVTENLF